MFLKEDEIAVLRLGRQEGGSNQSNAEEKKSRTETVHQAFKFVSQLEWFIL